MYNIISYKNRHLNPDIPVYVYKNLANGMFSLLQRGKVIGHTEEIWLSGCRFVVRASGKKKALATNQRNVHAFVVGMVVDTPPIPTSGGVPVRYNPFRDRGFMMGADTITRCDFSYISHLGIVAFI